MATAGLKPSAGPIPVPGKAALPGETLGSASSEPTTTSTSPAPEAPQHFLQRIQLFTHLTPENCQQVVKRMKKRDFPPNSVIVRENSPGSSMFFITAGLVEVRKKDPVTAIEFLVAELGPGKNFGEMSLLTGKPRTATVSATQPTTCAILEQSDFQDLLLEFPEIGVAMTRILAERVAEATAHMGVDFINLAKMQIDPRVLELIPQSMCMQHHILPVSFCNNRLTLGMTNPNNILAFDDVRRVVKGVMVEPVLITDEDFRKFMSTTYVQLTKKDEEPVAAGMTAGTTPATAGKSRPEVTVDLLQSDIIRGLQMTEDDVQTTSDNKQELMNASEDAPIIRLSNSILGLAIKKGASDIHVEPQEKDVVVRFRIDGNLQTVQNLPKKVQLGLISRLKILSKLDISEKRMPQDGRISVSMEGKPIDFRVSTVPAKWGEKVCMRILDKANTTLGLEKVISHAETLALVRSLINQPYGILYVTGPTGSGKTTTLYSALAELNNPEYNISTVEDPVEYDLSGINQIQVNKDIGLDFPRVLRAFLRQDPDIILVGETRDKETAHIAVEAALTGHMVFTTLHTNSAAGTFTRLGEMGVEPFLVSSSTIGVMAQRLARRNCPGCREQYEAEDHICEFMGLPPKSTLWRGRGCDRCNGKGVRGRIGIYEVMKMNSELRAMVARAALTEDIHAAALRSGMLDLKKYAALLLLEGETNVEEVLQVVSVQD
ncbi:MAG: Flp pilus assembly complex ATPase component TadA [Acidobacteria bacterium]|nr:Flp pilus assembly complex ATPase component TadA [Acidobacteriota bacterium]MBV9435552.1 Flp pilus assembly complex ATPase component TadA [Acidobacteriota bacterium]